MKFGHTERKVFMETNLRGYVFRFHGGNPFHLYEGELKILGLPFPFNDQLLQQHGKTILPEPLCSRLSQARLSEKTRLRREKIEAAKEKQRLLHSGKGGGVREKKCKGCGNKFAPIRTFQKACSVDCALALVALDKKRAERKKDFAKRKSLKTLSEWLSDLQVLVNRYRRLQEAGQPCISCLRPYDLIKKKNAGHFLSRGSHPELRFAHDNIWLQCEPCNTSKSGNHGPYRKNLIEKIGIERVQWLEGPHPPLRLRIPEIEAEIIRYRGLIKSLEAISHSTCT